MFGRILKKDISRNKVITATLFLFILLAAMLVSGAVHIIITLYGSMDSLFALSHAPHYVQMHSGALNQEEIDAFSDNNPLVKSQQTVTMLGINGANLYLGNNEASEANSIIENSFVTQNTDFDLLLNTSNQVIHVSDGEIAVPIYHMQKYGLKLGDTVRIATNDFDKTFIITAFVRDVQMNPSIVTSKRFVVSENDWKHLQGHIGQLEYLIEFLLTDKNRVSEFETIYQASSLPQKDTAITYPLYRVLNAVTDGIVAAVIIAISLLLIAIAALCLRFTLIATIEEDYREIGVMKAIGISGREIRRLYLIKYAAVAAVASLLGYGISFFVRNLFTANISLYMGTAPKTVWGSILPALGALLVFLIVVFFCRIVLRRFRKISAVRAMRSGIIGRAHQVVRGYTLSRCHFGNINIFLGTKAVLSQFRVYGVLCFIFIVCVFLMQVPFNFLNTLKSPDFVSYMGAGRSDIRMDIFTRQSEGTEHQYEEIRDYLAKDREVRKYALLVTAAYQVKNAAGEYENIKIENGDFSVFPLTYLHGAAPKTESEIALSSMNADDLHKSVGDPLSVLVKGKERTLAVSGVYQDITNGGKTAKGLLPYDRDNVLWCIIGIEVADGVSIPGKIAEYQDAFANVKITDMADYVVQTLGGLISQISLAAILAFALAIVIAVLITALFFKMLIVKDTTEIAIMRSLGLSCRDIGVQYITRGMIVLFLGTVLGSIVAVTLGQKLAGILISGVSSMRFVINPLMSFFVCPIVLIIGVWVTVYTASGSIQRINCMSIIK